MQYTLNILLTSTGGLIRETEQEYDPVSIDYIIHMFPWWEKPVEILHTLQRKQSNQLGPLYSMRDQLTSWTGKNKKSQT